MVGLDKKLCGFVFHSFRSSWVLRTDQALLVCLYDKHIRYLPDKDICQIGEQLGRTLALEQPQERVYQDKKIPSMPGVPVYRTV